MVSTSEDELVDPVMSIRYTKISLEIKRSDAMDVLGKFGCKCQAASNKGEVASREASINVACKSSFLHCYFFFKFFCSATLCPAFRFVAISLKSQT